MLASTLEAAATEILSLFLSSYSLGRAITGVHYSEHSIKAPDDTFEKNPNSLKLQKNGTVGFCKDLRN